MYVCNNGWLISSNSTLMLFLDMYNVRERFNVFALINLPARRSLANGYISRQKVGHKQILIIVSTRLFWWYSLRNFGIKYSLHNSVGEFLHTK